MLPVEHVFPDLRDRGADRSLVHRDPCSLGRLHTAHLHAAGGRVARRIEGKTYFVGLRRGSPPQSRMQSDGCFRKSEPCPAMTEGMSSTGIKRPTSAPC